MENKRIVLCTSTGCLQYGPERYRNLGIEQIHVVVNYGGKDYLEGKDLDPWSFFKMEETIEDPKNHLPHSAIPPLGNIKAKFEELIQRGYNEAIIIVLSSYLGGTYNVIKLASEDYEDKIKFTIIDCKITCFGEGLLAVQAQDLVNKGVDTDTIIKEIHWSMAHQEFIGSCAKLDYLVYNGRLKGGKAFMGKLLQVVPVMHFSHDGVLEPFAQALGLKKGIIACIEKIKEIIGDRSPEDYLLWHNYTSEHSADLYKELEKEYGLVCNHEDVIISPVVGCHTGPYLAGYGLFMKRRPDEPLED